jgi:hypothetical protein
MVTFTTCSVASIENLDKCLYFPTFRITFIIKTCLDLILYVTSMVVLVSTEVGSGWGFKALIGHFGSLLVLAGLINIAQSVISFMIVDSLTFTNLETILVLSTISYSFILYGRVKKVYQESQLVSNPKDSLLPTRPPIQQGPQPPNMTTSKPMSPSRSRSHSIREKVEEDKSDLKFKGSLPVNTIEAMKLSRLNSVVDGQSVLSRQR